MLSKLFNKSHYTKVYLIALAFVALNLTFIAYDFYYLSFLPAIIIILFLGFISLDRLIYVIAFFVPLSIPFSRIAVKSDIDFFIPTEILLAGVLILFFLKFLKGHRIDQRIIHHPVSYAIYFNLFWIFITAITSTMMIVSIKFFIARIWFLISFYFLAAQIFQERRNFNTYIWSYIIPFIGVIFYFIIRLSDYGLNNQQAANFVTDPFFNDHTSYGAMIAMIIPPLIGMYVNNRNIKGLNLIMPVIILIFLTALVLSYTRAAWLSIICVFFIWILIKLRVKWQYITITTILILGLAFSLKTQVFLKLEQNQQTSSGEFGEHIKSMINIRNDVSNLERINRWNCALRMFKEKPIFGWGPGTYMFQYAPFQISNEKTKISTNTGTRGNAHSEYLGPLAEQGLPGLLSILSIVGLIIWTGLRVYLRSEIPSIRIMTLSVLLGLCTYYIHGAMNNFLDTDKASALFWGFSAFLVAIDINHYNPSQKK